MVHGGGFVPYQAGRFQHGWQVRPEPERHLKCRPAERSDASTRHHPAREAAARIPGALVRRGRVMLGSDYPFDMGTLECARQVEALSIAANRQGDDPQWNGAEATGGREVSGGSGMGAASRAPRSTALIRDCAARGRPAGRRRRQGRRADGEADLQGSDGHGVIRLPQYVKRIRAGGINVTPNIRVVQERAGDGGGRRRQRHGPPGRVACGRGGDREGPQRRRRLGRRARQQPRRAGALYARMPIEHDMIGLYFAVGNANHLPPWGGMDMLLSTNPIAAGIPAGEEPAVVLDMATTVAAYGKVKAKAAGRDDARRLDDRSRRPAAARPGAGDEGFLLPIGGHKGYGLALVWACWPARCRARPWAATSSTSMPTTTPQYRAGDLRDRHQGLWRAPFIKPRSTPSSGNCTVRRYCPASTASACPARTAITAPSSGRRTACRCFRR